MSRTGKSIGSRLDEWLPGNWKGGKLGATAKGNGASNQGDWKALYLHNGDGSTTMDMLKPLCVYAEMVSFALCEVYHNKIN